MKAWPAFLAAIVALPVSAQELPPTDPSSVPSVSPLGPAVAPGMPSGPAAAPGTPIAGVVFSQPQSQQQPQSLPQPLPLPPMVPPSAHVMPAPGPGDSRLQTVIWHPDEVVTLTAAPNTQMVLMLSADERVTSVALGDSQSWQVTVSHSGDSVFLKPLRFGATTNMTVITDARIYTFDLQTSDGPAAAYVVRFAYPDEHRGRSIASAEPTGEPVERYKLAGRKSLRPVSVADDGVRTFVSWGPSQAIPAVFALDEAGHEITVDGYMRDGVYTIDRVYPELVFRIDRYTAKATRETERRSR